MISRRKLFGVVAGAGAAIPLAAAATQIPVTMRPSIQERAEGLWAYWKKNPAKWLVTEDKEAGDLVAKWGCIRWCGYKGYSRLPTYELTPSGWYIVLMTRDWKTHFASFGGGK